MKLLLLHPGCSIRDVQENSSFKIIIPDEVKTTPEPTNEELQILREEIDPQRIFSPSLQDLLTPPSSLGLDLL